MEANPITACFKKYDIALGMDIVQIQMYSTLEMQPFEWYNHSLLKNDVWVVEMAPQGEGMKFERSLYCECLVDAQSSSR